MSYTLSAASLPVPLGPTAQYLTPTIASPTANAPQAARLASGTTLSPYFNSNATRADIASVYAPGFGIMNGLVLSISSGLTASVSAGQANIYGVAELQSATTIVLPDSTADIYVWLKSVISDGVVTNSLTYTTTTTPPSTSPTSGTCVYLGHAVTSGGAITGIDMSGVVYLNTGGIPTRFTADKTMPADSPSSNTSFITDCPGGAFLWDGTRYTKLSQAGTFTATVTAALTTAQQRSRMLTASGAGNYTLTISPAEGEWIVKNPTAGTLSLYDGAVTITVTAGKTALVGCTSTALYRITADV